MEITKTEEYKVLDALGMEEDEIIDGMRQYVGYDPKIKFTIVHRDKIGSTFVYKVEVAMAVANIERRKKKG